MPKFQDRHTFQFRDLPVPTVIGQNAYIVRMPPRCPDVIYITGAKLAAQLWTNPGSTGTNFLSSFLDKGGRYCEASGFPADQRAAYNQLIGMNILKVGGTFDVQQFDPPLRYCKSEGDVLGIDLAAGGANGTGGQFGWQVSWETETPPTWPSKPDAVNGGDDLNTHVLIHCDEYPSHDMDVSAWPHLTRIFGDGSLDKTVKRFGRRSFKPYTTAGGCIGIVYASDLALGAGNFTWELFARPFAVNEVTKVLLSQSATFGPLQIYQFGAEYRLCASSNGTSWNVINAASMGAAVANEWTHLAVIRDGASITLWRDGVQQGAAINVGSTALYDPGLDWTIGARGHNGPIALHYPPGTPLPGGGSINNAFVGHIDEIRFSNVARNPALFPPTAAYCGDPEP